MLAPELYQFVAVVTHVELSVREGRPRWVPYAALPVRLQHGIRIGLGQPSTGSIQSFAHLNTNVLTPNFYTRFHGFLSRHPSQLAEFSACSTISNRRQLQKSLNNRPFAVTSVYCGVEYDGI